jgi:hypothetical protein
MIIWDIVIVLITLPLSIYFIKKINPCDILGHDFVTQKNSIICKRCGLMMKRAKK